MAAAAGLVLSACGSAGASNLDGTSWDFFAYDIADATIEKLEGTNPTLAFEDDRVTGSDGCNDFNGSYDVSSGNRITIGPLASTQKACEPDVMAQADVILSVISDAFLFEKTTDGELFIRTETVQFVGYTEQADE